MVYLLSFLEGIITFISPCLLPMLPVYISYFAGQGRGGRFGVLVGALGFILGFTAVFVALGALSGTLGAVLTRYQTAVNIVCGVVMIVLGLHFMEIFKLPFLNRGGMRFSVRGGAGFLRALLFGVVFSISWTPCVGVFLGSALMLAAQSGAAARGIIMLLLFSAGLGIPFLLCAVLIDRLKSAFDFIKRHYAVITKVSGGLLVAAGLLVALGMTKYLYFLA